TLDQAGQNGLVLERDAFSLCAVFLGQLLCRYNLNNLAVFYDNRTVLDLFQFRTSQHSARGDNLLHCTFLPSLFAGYFMRFTPPDLQAHGASCRASQTTCRSTSPGTIPSAGTGLQ